MLRPTVFSTTSLEKEPEILASLRKAFSHYAVEGAISLPKPKPDIDFLVRDDSSSTLVIAELKWVRKTGRPVEFTDRDGDVLKGVGQLEQIKRFLIDNPHHLSSLIKLPRSPDGIPERLLPARC